MTKCDAGHIYTVTCSTCGFVVGFDDDDLGPGECERLREGWLGCLVDHALAHSVRVVPVSPKTRRPALVG